MEQRLIGRQKLTDGRDALAQEAREEIAEITEAEWILRRGAYLVILDDVGKEHRTASGWAAQEFELLLRERYDSGLPTIITTNLSFDKWDAEYSQNLRSFATEACPAVEFGG
jgi:DNA replication protein DnaC